MVVKAKLGWILVLLAAGCLQPVPAAEPSGPRPGDQAEEVPFWPGEPTDIHLPMFLANETCIIHEGSARLVGTMIPEAGSSASIAVIVLHGDLIVEAVIITGNGTPGQDATGLYDEDTPGGQPGTQGGSIVLLAPHGTLELRHGAVRLGDGGEGGDAWREGQPIYGGSGGAAGMFATGAVRILQGDFEVHPGHPGQPGRSWGHDDEDARFRSYRGESIDQTMPAERAEKVATMLQGSCSNIPYAVGYYTPLPYD